MADKDPRTYVRIHDGMPDHPKVDGLSDAAFRLLVTLWCWCSRHLTDGAVPAATWEKRGKQKARNELITARLVDVHDDGSVSMHDYTQHQRTADEVQAIRDARTESGLAGNHKRWHTARGITDPECSYCSDPKAVANGSQTRSQNDRESSPETETETEVLTNVSTLVAKMPRAGKKASRIPEPFIVDDAMKDWALERDMQPQWVMKHTERFINYWLGIGGQKGTKTNWRTTWMNWLLREQDKEQPAYSAPAPVARRHVPLEVPDHIDPDDGPAYAAWLREASL